MFGLFCKRKINKLERRVEHLESQLSQLRISVGNIERALERDNEPEISQLGSGTPKNRNGGG